MDAFAKISLRDAAPCIIFAFIFGITGHYFETKPQMLALGVLAIFSIKFTNLSEPDKMLEQDLINLRNENESLKRNLMQVYSMVQQKPTAPTPPGPPPPIPPSMAAPPATPPVMARQEEDDGAKPYV